MFLTQVQTSLVFLEFFEAHVSEFSDPIKLGWVWRKKKIEILPISSSSLFQSIVVLDSGEIVMEIFEFSLSVFSGNAKI